MLAERRGDDDSKYCGRSTTLRQWHAGALAALASERDTEQRQGASRLLPGAFGTLLQRKCPFQEGVNARCLLLFAVMLESSGA